MTTQTSTDGATEAMAATGVPIYFEAATIPVTDNDRAKAFYQGLGWRLDADFDLGESGRVLQFTPPQSPASIQFGPPTKAAPGTFQGLLVVEDIVAAREELVGRGVEVSEIWHHSAPAQGMEPGIDPERRSYFSHASFADPDDNTWVLQEITERLPGRVW